MKLNEIYLGDAYKLIKEIPDKSIDLIYTDVPYLYTQGGGGSSELGKRTARKRIELMGVLNDYEDILDDKTKRTYALQQARKTSKTKEENSNMEDGFDFKILDEYCRVMKRIYIYIWCSKLQIFPLMKYFAEDRNCNFDILTWHKTNPTPSCNNCYPPDTEYCLLFREKGTGMGGNMKTLKKYYISPINKEDKDEYGHPTIKPIQFVKDMIFNSTKKGDVVLDTFMGSGTTAVACKELDRHYVGFELNPKYYQIAIDRVNGITKEDREALDKGQLTLF
jgi:DNA modification methylase